VPHPQPFQFTGDSAAIQIASLSGPVPGGRSDPLLKEVEIGAAQAPWPVSGRQETLALARFR